jgi:hypothetical protein
MQLSPKIVTTNTDIDSSLLSYNETYERKMKSKIPVTEQSSFEAATFHDSKLFSHMQSTMPVVNVMMDNVSTLSPHALPSDQSVSASYEADVTDSSSNVTLLTCDFNVFDVTHVSSNDSSVDFLLSLSPDNFVNTSHLQSNSSEDFESEKRNGIRTSAFSCDLCINSKGSYFVCFSELKFREHINGKSHKKNSLAATQKSVKNLTPDSHFTTRHVVRGKCVIGLHCGFCQIEFDNKTQLDNHLKSSNHLCVVNACEDFFDVGFDSGFVQGLLYAKWSESKIHRQFENTSLDVNFFGGRAATFAASRIQPLSHDVVVPLAGATPVSVSTPFPRGESLTAAADFLVQPTLDTVISAHDDSVSELEAVNRVSDSKKLASDHDSQSEDDIEDFNDPFLEDARFFEEDPFNLDSNYGYQYF